MSSKYRYEYEDEDRRYLRICDHCSCEVPLHLFDGVHTEHNSGIDGEKQWMCEVCSGTSISAMLNYRSLYSDDTQSMMCLAQVANLLLDKLTDRKPPESES